MRFISSMMVLFISSATLYSANNSAPESTSEYCLIGSFGSLQAGIVIEPTEIKAYKSLRLERWDKDFIEKHIIPEWKTVMPGWNGEKYEVDVYKWLDTSFILQRKFYTNDASKAKVKVSDYDTSLTRDLRLPEKFLKVWGIRFISGIDAVKAYAEGDLNGDGRRDLAVVYADTIRTKYPYADYSLYVYEKQKNGEYEDLLIFKFQDAEVGKLEIMDTNNDGLQDLILWTRGYTASTWTINASIFSSIPRH